MKRAEGRTLSTLIPVLVTGIQQRRVCGAGNILSAQGLGLAGSCDKHRNEEIKQAAAVALSQQPLAHLIRRAAL
jgi:peroxiredoxin